MATFEDTVDKLGKTTSKLDAAADKMSAANSESSGAAAKEQANEANRRADKSNTYLESIAGTLSGMQSQFKGADSKESGKAGGIFAGIARAVGGLGAGIGSAIGGLMKGIGKAAVFAPKFVIAMGALGLGVGAFIVAIGGAAAIASKMFPTIAEGLKSFEGHNGKNLVNVGLGMAAIGVGLGAQGIGGALSAVGNLVGGIAGGIGNLLGIKSGPESTLEKMRIFGEAKINAKGVKANAEAMNAYGIAMAAGGAGSMLSGLGTLGDAVFTGLGKLIGGVPPLEKMKLFGEAKINHEGVKANAASMVTYMEAMAVGAGATALKAVGGLANVAGTAMDGLSKFLGGKGVLETQLDGMRKLSSATGIDPAKIKAVAGAMVEYAKVNAIGAGAEAVKAVGGLGNMVSSFTDGISKFIGGKGTLDTQIEGMQKLSAAKGIDPVQIKFVAGAMVEYAKAMAAGAAGEAGKAGGAVGNMVSNIADGLSSFFGGGKSDPLGDLIKFSARKITAEQAAQVKINADALVTYGMGLAKFAGTQVLKGGGDLLSSLAEGLSSFFGKDNKVDPMTALQRFASKVINVGTVENNVKALEAFAMLGSGYTGNPGMSKFIEEMGDNLPQIESLINGSEATGVKVFGKRLGKVAIKGLGSPDIMIDEAKTNIEKLKAVVQADFDAKPASPAPTGETGSPDVYVEPDAQEAQGKTNFMWAEGLQRSIEQLSANIANVQSGSNNNISNQQTTNLAAGSGQARRPATSRRLGNNANAEYF